MISLKQREHANGYLDVVMTPNEMLDRGGSGSRTQKAYQLILFV